MEEKRNLPEGITEAMIEAAKEKYGKNNVKLLELPIDDASTEYKTVLCTVPSRTIMGQYRKLLEVDPKRADETLVKNCILSHKDEVLSDDGLFWGAVSGLAELVPIRKAIIKNL